MIWQDGKLLSPGAVLPGDRVYHGMRIWDPGHSKVAALCHIHGEPPVRNARILYLGAAAGSTVSFLSDYAEVVYAVEFSPRPVRSLIRLARARKNIIPLFEDARYPERYLPFVEPVDLLIQDIAQRDQAEIALRNLIFLKQGGHLILFLKLLSMGTDKKREDRIVEVVNLLEHGGITDPAVLDLDRYHTGHTAVWGIYSLSKNFEK
ncbi:rRNA 2'-O-methyltransferase fibrillarin [Methanospirillum hungatei JF-1]|uniref:Fibrillarin-like rRNA/tRNA 2'-O-methyltransferase n=1 Tax=Methanospirillum hungatei JF-1 (strain ATCC 27890 / DSM 864 / NBRC 100397 / JF-1) TaxID=323259 RepID=FLPA_METHJ|nr:RecName: Full=Fibrillarin-like rRNA/tRNA 2'-O-methyltransferase [Methanospirillum hungatei JF-1]ABD41969.1 rRNA 2'-O-methyltransferase fibrillarin [Methanospirillum hungatei JF-1]